MLHTLASTCHDSNQHTVAILVKILACKGTYIACMQVSGVGGLIYLSVYELFTLAHARGLQQSLYVCVCVCVCGVCLLPH